MKEISWKEAFGRPNVVVKKPRLAQKIKGHYYAWRLRVLGRKVYFRGRNNEPAGEHPYIVIQNEITENERQRVWELQKQVEKNGYEFNEVEELPEIKEIFPTYYNEDGSHKAV